MSYVLLGVTIIVSVVIAMGLYTFITWKLMMSPKVMAKVYKQTFNAAMQLNDQILNDFEEKGDEEE